MKTLTAFSLALIIAAPANAGTGELDKPFKLGGVGTKRLEGPEFADVDGDGKKDLLSGVYAGNLYFRKNTGTEKEPKFADEVVLQTGGKDIKLKHW